VSFGVTLIAIAWVASYLRLSARARRTLLGVFAADCIMEVTGISIQAWRGVASHFNDETTFDSVIAYSLAFGGAVLVVVLGSLAVMALRGRIDAAPSMRLAIQSGFTLLLAGLAAGVAMIARGEVLIRTGHRQAAYDTAGFLKWFHGVTLHAILVLPILAWWLARTSRSESDRVRIVRAATAVYVITAVLILIVSLSR
jgi:hypothetical protein